jgi:V/A-type H+-transporting ATPase subunit I
MLLTYTVFFGIMFGDAGQGLCLAVLGFLLYKKSKAWLWRIIGICGCSSVVFGLFYGSVFGLEDLLPWGGYHPLESEHIMPVLLAGAALGVVVLLVCMVLNIVNSIRLGDVRSAFFSPNGLSGAVLYTAVILAIVCAYTGAANLLVGWYICLFIVLPILLIWFGEPLAKLVQGDKDWKPESWGMFIVEGFFDIFEAAISYMSNTMSFLRLGAFAISHAGMMMVVSMLSENMAATGSLIVMIIGNIFVAFLEAALSSIQIIRLEFYEIFGRFYVSGGKDFAPITVQYTK